MPRGHADPRRIRGFEAALASAVFLLISIWAAATQQAERIFGDAQMYHRMAQQFGEGQLPLTVDAPFVYRPATPWLASVFNPFLGRVLPPGVDFAIEDASGLKGVPGFYLVNIGATFATVLLLLAWMRAFLAALPLRLLAVTLWVMAWYAPTRFIYFYPVTVEPFFLLSVAMALLVIERMRRAPDLQAGLAVTPLIFVGTLARESMVVVLPAFLVSRLTGDDRKALSGTRVAGLLFPMAGFAAAVAVTRAIAAPANGFDTVREAARLASEKPLYT